MSYRQNFEEKVYMIHYFISFHDDFFLKQQLTKTVFLCILFYKKNIPFSYLFINIFKKKQLTNLYEDILNKKILFIYLFMHIISEE